MHPPHRSDQSQSTLTPHQIATASTTTAALRTLTSRTKRQVEGVSTAEEASIILMATIDRTPKTLLPPTPRKSSHLASMSVAIHETHTRWDLTLKISSVAEGKRGVCFKALQATSFLLLAALPGEGARCHHTPSLISYLVHPSAILMTYVWIVLASFMNGEP